MTPNDDAGFVDLLTQRAAREPQRVYARYCGDPVTYGEIERRSGAFATHLRERGLKPGDRVAVMMRNSVAVIAVVFGLARAGVVWVPVNAQQRGEGLRYLLTHPQPKLIVVDEDLAGLVEDALPAPEAPPILRQGAELDAILGGMVGFDKPVPAPNDVFAIMYTSGTTGRPKGVVVSHRMLRLAAEGVGRVSAAQPGEVFFVWEPLYHIGGAQLLALPMIRDVTLAMVDRFSASRFWSQVKAEGATHIHHLGGILQILLKQPEGPLDRDHGVRISWGGGCPADIWPLFRDRFGIEIRECYGMTEASSITTCNDNGVVGSVGRPMPWFGVRLLGADGQPVPQGERGEIVVDTDIQGAIFPGYLDNPEATAKALRGGALHTGDLGSWDADGNLFFHGRMTDSVRCKGENVSAWEVEHVAAEHEDIEDCAMIGVASDVGEQDIKLFVKPREGAKIEEAALSDWLGARLAPYQNPRYIAFVDDFERTASQRIMKHKLSPRLDDAWDRASPRPGPRIRGFADMTHCDILISGTGSFAARIAFDIAAVAAGPVEVVIAGRNRGRLDWLRTAANARAILFGSKARFRSHAVDLLAPHASDTLLAETNPRILVQAASIQTSQIIAQSGNAWTRLVAEGGLSATAVFQALISSRVAEAISRRGQQVTLINCSFPDVVNGMITAQGHQVACGMGNVAILSNVFAGSASVARGAQVKVLAHYQNLAAWRQPPELRSGRPPRVWIDGTEVEDVFARFADVQLTPEPVIEISGASGVPMLLAMADGRDWQGHAPGPNGLPGGYPVRLSKDKVALDLPPGLATDEAVRWNTSFEGDNGMIVGDDGRIDFTGILRDRLVAHRPGLGSGFAVGELEAVCSDLLALRDQLIATS